MSSVRMCDVPLGKNGERCGKVFSELDENWSTGNMVVWRRNPQTGKREQISVNQDRCPRHSEGIAEAIDPQPAPAADDMRNRIQALEAADLQWRISQAEQAAAARRASGADPS